MSNESYLCNSFYLNKGYQSINISEDCSVIKADQINGNKHLLHLTDPGNKKDFYVCRGIYNYKEGTCTVNPELKKLISETSPIQQPATVQQPVAQPNAQSVVAPVAQPNAQPVAVPDATECRGWDCSIEGQNCPKGVPGASSSSFCCTNGKWVEGECKSATPDANVPKSVELNIYPTNVHAFCGANSGTGNKQTTMKWVGETCGDNKIQWNSMSTVSNLACGLTEDRCKWKRADYTSNSNWAPTYVGSCGVAPTVMPNLPMTVDKVEEHNKLAVNKCWKRMPTGCDKNLSETNCDETQHKGDTGWFIDPNSGDDARCTQRNNDFNSYCVKSDVMSSWGLHPPSKQ